MARFLTEAAGFQNTPAFLGERGVRARRAASRSRLPRSSPSCATRATRGAPCSRRSTATSTNTPFFRRPTMRGGPAGPPAPPRRSPLRIRSTSPLALGRRTAELHAALRHAHRRSRLRRRADRRRRHRPLGRRGDRARATRRLRQAASAHPACRKRRRPKVAAARIAHGDLRPPRKPARPRRLRPEDPHPRRLPSRPGAGRPGRRDDHRLRGRAAARHRRAARRRPRRCATSPACCAPSTMPPGRRSTACARATARCRRMCATAPSPGATRRRTISSTATGRAPRAPGSCRTTWRPAASCCRLFLFQKAFYEIGYEAANRPAWLSIPVRGVLDLTASSARPAGDANA